MCLILVCHHVKCVCSLFFAFLKIDMIATKIKNTTLNNDFKAIVFPKKIKFRPVQYFLKHTQLVIFRGFSFLPFFNFLKMYKKYHPLFTRRKMKKKILVKRQNLWFIRWYWEHRLLPFCLSESLPIIKIFGKWETWSKCWEYILPNKSAVFFYFSLLLRGSRKVLEACESYFSTNLVDGNIFCMYVRIYTSNR